MKETSTVRTQRDVELSLLDFLRRYNPRAYALWRHHPEYEEPGVDEDTPSSLSVVGLMRRKHMEYLRLQLGEHPNGSEGLYPAQPWLVYWSLQAADMLGIMDSLLAEVPATEVGIFLLMCLAQQPTSPSTLPVDADAVNLEGAPVEPPLICFAGGPNGHIPHIAASYAACCSLCMLSDPVYLDELPRAAIKRWLLSLRTPDGSFRVHWGGEADVRASYCAAVLTTLLRLDEPSTFPEIENGISTEDVASSPVLTAQTAGYVASCQTHEGGFACSSYASEGHGAYTQCGIASLLLMRQPHLCHHASLRRWLAARQLQFEGGFNGRTNKLVDSCYSHWVGASHVLLRVAESYAKLLSTRRIGGSESSGGGTSTAEVAPPPPLRSREVMFLDHAQLLDASVVSCIDEAAWNKEEAAHTSHVEIADGVISADDDVLRDVKARRERAWAAYSLLGAYEVGGGDSSEAHPPKSISSAEEFAASPDGDYYFNQRKLQQYVLRCCQNAEEGGLMDKPGSPNDAYHTCYSLSGMSSAQNCHYLVHANTAASVSPYIAKAMERGYLPQRLAPAAQRTGAGGTSSYGVVLGVEGPSPAADISVLRTTNPIFNIHRSRVLSALNNWGPKTFL